MSLKSTFDGTNSIIHLIITVYEHNAWIPWGYLANTSVFIITFPFEIRMKKYILTNQRKNEYFQENEKKSIEITREMILFDDPNESIERKSKT